ncbi:MAG: hypothetical protein OQK03_02520, partial [Colwellia sp.]|nr:hypothetical protein [Colwellia sp.]
MMCAIFIIISKVGSGKLNFIASSTWLWAKIHLGYGFPQKAYYIYRIDFEPSMNSAAICL